MSEKQHTNCRNSFRPTTTTTTATNDHPNNLCALFDYRNWKHVVPCRDGASIIFFGNRRFEMQESISSWIPLRSHMHELPTNQPTNSHERAQALNFSFRLIFKSQIFLVVFHCDCECGVHCGCHIWWWCCVFFPSSSSFYSSPFLFFGFGVCVFFCFFSCSMLRLTETFGRFIFRFEYGVRS